MRIIFRLDAVETAERDAVLEKDPDAHTDALEVSVAEALAAAWGAEAQGHIVDGVDLEDATGIYLYTLAGDERDSSVEETRPRVEVALLTEVASGAETVVGDYDFVELMGGKLYAADEELSGSDADPAQRPLVYYGTESEQWFDADDKAWPYVIVRPVVAHGRRPKEGARGRRQRTDTPHARAERGFPDGRSE